jgi:hypothetical protein
MSSKDAQAGATASRVPDTNHNELPPVTNDVLIRHESQKDIRDRSVLSKAWEIINWMPPWCRWDAANPPQFSLGLNILFGFAGAITVANLYYNVSRLEN